MALMQLQLRQNSEDLQSFLRDLDSWEEEIKEKDEGLKRRKPILKEVGRDSQILFHVIRVGRTLHYFVIYPC